MLEQDNRSETKEITFGKKYNYKGQGSLRKDGSYKLNYLTCKIFYNDTECGNITYFNTVLRVYLTIDADLSLVQDITKDFLEALKETDFNIS